MAQAHEELRSWVLPGLPEGEEGQPDEAGGQPAEADPKGRAALTRMVRALLATPGSASLGRGRRGGTEERVADMAEGDADAEPAGARAATEDLQQGDLLLPDMLPTRTRSLQLLLLNAAARCNFRAPPGSCCTKHAGLAQIRAALEQLAQSDCQLFLPFRDFQCNGCGVLDEERHLRCELCGKRQQEALPAIREASEGRRQAEQPDARCSL